MDSLDSQFDQLQQAVQSANPSSTTAYTIPRIAPGSPIDPSAGPGNLQIGSIDTGITLPQGVNRVLAGAGQGLTDIGRHIANLVGAESDQDLANAKQIDAPLLATGAGRAGQLLGQTAAMLPVGMGIGAGVGSLGALGARVAANPVMMGAVQGATQGGVLADPGQRLQGTLLGGIAGSALPAAAQGIGSLGSAVAQGVSRTPAADALLNAGVPLTPGQLNPRGVFNRMEQALEAVPPIGSTIQNARERAMTDYSRAMLQRSMPPGATLPADATNFNDMINAASNAFDTAYDVGKGYPVGAKIMTTTGTDIPLAQALKSATSKPQPGLKPMEQAQISTGIQQLLNQTIAGAKQSGGMQSDDLLQLRSTLRDLIRGESGADNASRATKRLYQNAADTVTTALESQIPPDAAQALSNTDAQYAKFAVIRNAAAAAKDKNGGTPTPFQISTAIAQATPKAAYARGAGANRDLSQAAADVFQSNVPRTGHTGVGSLMIPMMALGAAGGGAEMEGDDKMAGGLKGLGTLAALGGLGAALYSPAARNMLVGNTGFQRALASMGQQVGTRLPMQLSNLPGLLARSGTISAASPLLQPPLPPQN